MTISPTPNNPPRKSGHVVKTPSHPSAEQMALMNQYTRRTLEPQEVFSFGLILCDNDIDRDGEAFTLPALHTLRELFLGKTGIFDHDPTGHNQTARIYHTEVRTDAARKTATGEPYTYLFAQAYTVRSSKNADLILEIDAGIKKEVSVGCAIESISCSICGTDWKKKSCAHTKGADYGGKPCYGILDHPTDAYEWSFVAIPAQKNAGVIKRFLSPALEDHDAASPPLRPASHPTPSHQSEDSVAKSLAPSLGQAYPTDSTPPSDLPLTASLWIHKLAQAASATRKNGALTLSGEEVRSLQQYLSQVEAQTALAKHTISTMRERVARMHALKSPDVSPDLVQSVVAKMSFAELTAFDASYRAQSADLQIPPARPSTPSASTAQNEAFKTAR